MQRLKDGQRMEVSGATRKVSIVIPTWQRDDLLRRCLESLRRQTFSDFETVLVSNGASPQVDRLAEEFGCAVLRFPENRGFAAAINAGIAYGDCRYVALLNDDVELDRNWLQVTASFLEAHEEIAFCCGKIYQSGGTLLDNAGDAVSLGGLAWRLGFGRSDLGQYDEARTVLSVPGTAALFRRAVFEQVGGLDEDFISYIEDVEWSFRAARNGFRGYYLPQAVCVHEGSATLGKKSFLAFELATRNQLLLLVKHYPWQWWLRLSPRIAWAQLLWAITAMRNERGWAYCRGIARFLPSLPKFLRKRRCWKPAQREAMLALIQESERELYLDVTSPDRVEHGRFWKIYFNPFSGEPDGLLPRRVRRLPLR
ncbi:MAG: glycosyltransferase family 2 protein [Acidobacteria bacterium]|nr:glycosyltransferase family 2 protein [Acidobacteriota bacterium]